MLFSSSYSDSVTYSDSLDSGAASSACGRRSFLGGSFGFGSRRFLRGGFRLCSWRFFCGGFLAAGRSSSTRGGFAAGDALVDEGLHAVGEVPGEGLEQSGGARERLLEQTGDLGEEHLARRQLGQRRDLAGGDDPLAEQAALQDERFVVLAEFAQHLGRGRGVAVHERDRHRALEQVGDLVEPTALDRPAGQRVLEHLVLGAAGPQ